MIDWKEVDWDLSKPNRQSLIGVVVYLARHFRALITMLIALVAIAATQPKVWIYMGIGVIPLIVIFALLAYLRYRNFTFHVSDHDLIIHQGVFVKDRTVVPAARIQSIQITQNLLQRLVGLVSLKVDTAGSKGSELEIPALERPRAAQMQELLYAKKEEALARQQTKAPIQSEFAEGAATFESGADLTDGRSYTEPAPKRATSAGTDGPADSRAQPRVLSRLSFGDLILVGLTENHLKTGFVAVAFVFGYLSQYKEYIDKYFTGYVDSYAREMANAGIALVLGALLLYVVLSVVISVVRAFLRFFDLKAVLADETVEVSTGLLRRNEQRVPIQKIQYIEWHGNPLRRMVGFESAHIHPSGAVAERAKGQNIEIPALKPVQSAALAEGVFPGYRMPQTEIRANAAAYARFWVLLSLVALLPSALGLWFVVGWYALFVLFATVLVAVLGYAYGRTVRLLVNADFIVVRRGWVFPVRVVVPTFKVQAVETAHNIFLRRRGLSHFRLYTAAGGKSVRYLDAKIARELKDFLLFVVESHRGVWM